MTAYVALLRAVNVSGSGILPMAELRAMGEACGFTKVRTHIASGNLLFASTLAEDAATAVIEDKLEAFFGKPVPVFVRSAAEMKAIAGSNPFPDESGSRNMVFFLKSAVPVGFLEQVRGQQNERIALGGREISVAYGDGIRTSRLKLPDPGGRTGRNRNTVEKIAALLEEVA